jgi:nondiscriminating glutamyl-tRNA synthetase
MSVRVLFHLCVGGLDVSLARTAVLGWLWARHEGGQFIVSPTEAASALDDLRLLGLDWVDERASHGEEVQTVVLPPVEGAEAGITVREWLARGYSGLALANCLARLGWSPRGKRALLALDELADRFEIERVSRRPAVFDRRDLDWFNRRWLGALDANAVTALLVPYWRDAYGRSERAGGTALSPHDWQRTLALAVRDELTLAGQCVEKARFAFVDELELDAASEAILSQPYAGPILRAFVDELPSVSPFQFDPLDAFCRRLRLRFKDALGIRSRDVMYVLRAALAGRQDGPCLVVICQVLGPERCIRRARIVMRRVHTAPV